MQRLMQHGSIRGFTLIELMITIAVVAILVAIAVPAYKDYTIRAKFAECINNAAVPKVSISEYRQTLGAWPPSLTQAGLTNAGISQYCSGLINYQATTGAFTIDANEAAIDPSLDPLEPTMTPTDTPSGMTNWTCSRGSTAEKDVKYLPATCRGT